MIHIPHEQPRPRCECHDCTQVRAHAGLGGILLSGWPGQLNAQYTKCSCSYRTPYSVTSSGQCTICRKSRY